MRVPNSLSMKSSTRDLSRSWSSFFKAAAHAADEASGAGLFSTRRGAIGGAGWFGLTGGMLAAWTMVM